MFSFLASFFPSSLSEAMTFLPLSGSSVSSFAKSLYRPSLSRSMISLAEVAGASWTLTLLKTERMESAKFPLAKSTPPIPTTKASINAYSIIPCPFCFLSCFHPPTRYCLFERQTHHLLLYSKTVCNASRDTGGLLQRGKRKISLDLRDQG